MDEINQRVSFSSGGFCWGFWLCWQRRQRRGAAETVRGTEIKQGPVFTTDRVIFQLNNMTIEQAT